MNQDFSGQNLRGKHFQGQDLSGCNFSGADLRGANFTGAILKQTNFSGAKAGVNNFLLFLPCLLLTPLISWCSIFSGIIINPHFDTNNAILGSLTGLVLLILWAFLTVRGNLELGLLTTALISAFVGTIGTLSWDFAFSTIWAVASFTVWFWLRVLLGICALACGGDIGGVFVGFLNAIFGFVALIFGLITIGFFDFTPLIWGLFVYLAVSLFSSYVCRRALAGDERFSLPLNLTVKYASLKGTSFRSADLTEANFKQASLNYTDFRQANLSRCYWRECVNLYQARLENTVLENSQIRELLVTGNGRNQNYEDLNLQNLNLAGVDLQRADLRWVNLSETTLKKASLVGANLRGVQLVNTDLSRAELTGIVLDDLMFSDTTNFTDVVCDYVYLQSLHQLDRFPLGRDFAEGEFVAIQEDLKTIIRENKYGFKN